MTAPAFLNDKVCGLYYNNVINHHRGVRLMGKAKSYICGFAAGSVIAGMTVLLSTPKSGREIRGEMKEKVQQAKEPMNDVKNQIVRLKDQVNSLSKESLPVIKSTLGDIEDLVNTWNQAVKPHIHNIKENLSQLEQAKKQFERSQNEPTS